MSEPSYFVAAGCPIINTENLYDYAAEDFYKLDAIGDLLNLPCFEPNDNGFMLDFSEGVFYLLYVLIDKPSDESLEIRIGKENFEDLKKDIISEIGKTNSDNYLDLDELLLYVFHWYNGTDRPELDGSFIS